MDGFSTLPHDTVTKILSFLQAKDAVRTGVLSKELRHSWAFLPVLKVDIIDFLKNHDDYSEEQLREAELKLTEFLKGALQKLKSQELEIFEYRNGVVNSGVSLKFLDNILLLKPREVYIFLGRRTEGLDMLDSFFCCPSIEIIKFSVYCHDFSVFSPTAIQLDNLRKGHFKGMSLDDDHGFLIKLCLGCPKLNNLVLEVCALDIKEVSSSTLIELVIRESAQLRLTKISCQNLKSLVIVDCYQAMGYNLHNTESIEYVKIWIHLDENYGDWNLLRSLSNVSELSLSLWGPKIKVKLEQEISECRFINLKLLEIAYWDLNVDLYLVACFLTCSPSLESLTLRLCDKLAYDNPCCKELLEEKATEEGPRDAVLVQQEFLKTVRIIGFSKHRFVIKLIKNLHTYVRNIGKIIIDTSPGTG